METQKILNLLNCSGNEVSKFATKKWYVIDSESNGKYSHEYSHPTKFSTGSLEWSLCGCSDESIPVTRYITATTNHNANFEAAT